MPGSVPTRPSKIWRETRKRLAVGSEEGVERDGLGRTAKTNVPPPSSELVSPRSLSAHPVRIRAATARLTVPRRNVRIDLNPTAHLMWSRSALLRDPVVRPYCRLDRRVTQVGDGVAVQVGERVPEHPPLPWSTGTWFGTTRTVQPAASAERVRCWSPRSPRSPNGSTSRMGRPEVGLGVGLAVQTASPVTTASKVSTGSAARMGPRTAGRTSSPGRNEPRPLSGGEQLQRPRPPGDRASTRRDTDEELLDDHGRLDVDAQVLPDERPDSSRSKPTRCRAARAPGAAVIAPGRTRPRPSRARCRRGCRPCPTGPLPASSPVRHQSSGS